MSDRGCNYAVSKTQRWNAKDKKWEGVNILCHKLVAHNSELCPMHQLFVEDNAKKAERQAAKRKANKKYREEQMEILANSPLAAVNPIFEEKQKDLGYSK